MKCIWVPNSNVKLSEEPEILVGEDGTTTTSTKLVLNQDAEIPLTYKYCTGVDSNGDPVLSEYIYDPANTGNEFILAQGGQLCTADKPEGVAKLANQAPKIVSFEKDGVMEEKHLIIRIWFEGYDTECTEAMLGGNVEYTLSFAGMLTRSDLTHEQTAGFEITEGNVTDSEKIYYNQNDEGKYILHVPENLKGKLIYSKDGINYLDAPPENATFEEKQTIYLRIKETAETYASSKILMLTFAAQTADGT